MRRSSVVQLTLLPMLATAAAAAAGPYDAGELSPPGMAAQVAPGMELTPPGMTPTIMELPCEQDPSWRLRPDCADLQPTGSFVVRGGFGHYFWSGGGG
ncbi:MAG TPA: hypothetical protein VLX92_12345 [Kofleriaceae bacterium]|nr:hypothetical protein [Kofleriaceae bacterium]